MQLRSGRKTSTTPSVASTSVSLRQQKQVINQELQQIADPQEALLAKSISNYIIELGILKENKKDLIRHFDENEYWENIARNIIELTHILDENVDFMAQNTSKYTFIVNQLVDLFLYYRRKMLGAIREADLEYNTDILMSNTIYDIDNFIKNVETNYATKMFDFNA